MRSTPPPEVGAAGVVIVSIDAAGKTPRSRGRPADFAPARSGVQLEGLLAFDALNTPKNFIVVDADTLTAGTIDDTLLGVSPFIYNVGVTADTVNDDVLLSVRRRTAAEASLNPAQTAAFDAFYLALGEDEAVRDAFLARFTREQFLALYDQMLPAQGEGLFGALDYANLSVARAIATRPDPRQRYGPDSFWLQELNMQVKRDGGETQGSEAKGFGFVGGYEAMDDKGGALGLTLAYVNAEETMTAARSANSPPCRCWKPAPTGGRAAWSVLFSVRGSGGYASSTERAGIVAPSEPDTSARPTPNGAASPAPPTHRSPMKPASGATMCGRWWGSITST